MTIQKLTVTEKMDVFFKLLHSRIQRQFHFTLEQCEQRENEILKDLMYELDNAVQNYYLHLTNEAAKLESHNDTQMVVSKVNILASLAPHFVNYDKFNNAVLQQELEFPEPIAKQNQILRNDLTNFFLALHTHKKALTKRRDSAFKTFVKGLGVLGASIFGLGIGGYFAHKHLFGKQATEGNSFIAACKKEVADLSKDLSVDTKSTFRL